MNSTKKPWKYLLIFSLGFLAFAFPLFSEGMFMDGLIYAGVSDNLAKGDGSMWSLVFSEARMNYFHEHPPLAIWMESFFHVFFKGSFLAERFYSLSMWFLNALLIIQLWKEFKQPKELAWVPLLLWMLFPVVHWSFANNLLENTMGVFVSLSVLCYLKSLERNRWGYLIAMGGMLFLAFMSKGFVGLFPLVFPGIYALFFQKRTVLQGALEVAVIAISSLVMFYLLVWIWEAAQIYMLAYFKGQVQDSIENVQTVSTRWRIIWDFLQQLFVPLGIIGLLLIISKWKRSPLTTEERKWLGVLVLLILAGVVPIMISLKQRGFYILTVYPFVAIAVAIYLKPWFLKWDKALTKFVFRPVIAGGMVVVAVVLALISSGKVGRDQETLHDVKNMVAIVPHPTTFCVSESLAQDWSLKGYFARYYDCNVDLGSGCSYFIVQASSSVPELADVGFELLYSGQNLSLYRIVKQ